MKTGLQLAWVMVRMIVLILVLYAAKCMIAAGGSAYMAFMLRKHTTIVMQSDALASEHQKDTPQNRQLVNAHGHTQTAATLNGILFLISLAGGLYCLKRGRVLHRFLLPPQEKDARPPQN